MKHLSNKDITNYFFGNLPNEKSIKMGIHLDECFDCFSKAEQINAKTAEFEKRIDALISLPETIEAAQIKNKDTIIDVDKNSLIAVIQENIYEAGDSLKNKLEEILNNLRDPAFQLTPFGSLLNEDKFNIGLGNQPTSLFKSKEKAITIMPGKILRIKRVNKNHFECKFETNADDLPTIFYHSNNDGVEIVNFKKISGTNCFSAVIPQTFLEKHYLLHKIKNTRSRKK